MNKILVSGAVAVALFGAQIAFAQTYYPSSGVPCTNLASDLSYGARGSDVSALQTFLVAQNYPGSGSWMITGYFGSATLAAVRDYQQSRGLQTTGVADAATRSAIANETCGLPAQSGGSYLPGLGGSGYVPSSPYAYANTYNYAYGPYSYGPYQSGYGQCGTYPYYYPCGTSVGSASKLTSLSVTSGAPGTSVTIYGSGFDYANNTVYVGGTTVPNVPSYNGSALTFTLPSVPDGPVSISVGNSRGTSNSLTFTVSSYTTPYYPSYPTYPTYPSYPSYPSYPCSLPAQTGQYSYGYCIPPQGPPTIQYLSPNNGAVGASVTVYGYGFSTTGNSVRFGNGLITNLHSLDGTSVTFTVPSSLSGYGAQPVGLGTYNVSVTNNLGQTSNSATFTVTSTGQSSVAPTISSVNGPTTLQVGQQGTWTIQVKNPSGQYLSTTVKWGDENLYPYASAQPQTLSAQTGATLTFTHTYAQSGTYTVTFTVSNNLGKVNSATATVNVGTSSTGGVTLSSLMPTSGSVGASIVLKGSGFTPYDNTVHFGVGGTQHVPSYDGTTLYYTVPSYVSPCDVIQTFAVCAQYVQQVTPGSYQISVTNANGSSQALTFQVQ